MTASVQVWGIDGIPEITPREGATVAEWVIRAGPDLRDGDILVVTSKVVSKAEGRLVTGTREDHLAAETARVVARRGDTQIVQTHHGFVMAAAGIDASNVPAGTVALLPLDPDASARAIRHALRAELGVDVAVIVSDTMGRPWREGVTDVAIGAAGLDVLWDLRGQRDAAGHLLEATVIAIADELAAAADLVKGKLSSTPVAVIRGFPLTRNDPRRGARPLVRAAEQDMFRLGTEEAMREVVRRSAPVHPGTADSTGRTEGSGVGVPISDVHRAVASVEHPEVSITVAPDGRSVTAAGESLTVGYVLGRLAGALAADGLRATRPVADADGRTATVRIIADQVTATARTGAHRRG